MTETPMERGLTPRELTDEEAERGARAHDNEDRVGQECWFLHDQHQLNPDWKRWKERRLAAFRAAYRAITEEPAR